MISKEDFVKYMSLIQNFHSEQETIGVLIDKISDSCSTVVTIGDCLISTIIDIIIKDLEIEDKDLIEWWLYESVDKVIYFKDKEISVRTLEELYDYIYICKLFPSKNRLVKLR